MPSVRGAERGGQNGHRGMNHKHAENKALPEPMGAVILAAGSATRMGLRPKCLLELDGVSLLRRQWLALSGAGVQDVVVVLGHYAQRIRQSAPDMPVQWLLNPDPDAGQESSLRLGLQAMPPEVGAVLVLLADQALIEAQDIADLIAAYHQRPESMQLVRPVVDGLPGNPVIFSRSVAQQILAGPSSMGGRQWQQEHPEQVHRWRSNNSHYRTDVDSPEDLEALMKATGLQLRWPADLQIPSGPAQPA
jgi:molybdenum cofactor cytidylyltransferase